jgi:hypothetical protein
MRVPDAACLVMPRRSLGFLAAVHDIGTFSRNVQAMAPAHWPAQALGASPPKGVPAGPLRDAMGLHLLDGPPDHPWPGFSFRTTQ